MARPKKVVQDVEDIAEEVLEPMPEPTSSRLNSDLQEIQDELAGKK